MPSFGGGGAERVMVSLANQLISEVDYVDMLVGSNAGPLKKDLDSCVNVICFDQLRMVSCIPGIVRYLRRAKPDALLSTIMHANVVAIFSSLIARSQSTVVVREANATGLHNDSKNKFILRIAKLLYPYANTIVCVSDVVRQDLRRTLKLSEKVPVEVIYNPVLSDAYFKKLLMPPTPAIPGDSNQPLVLSAGRLSLEKDFATLLRAFSKLRAERNARLVILGEGELREELIELSLQLGISEDCYFPGFIDNPLPYMKAAQVFVLSSLSEGMPNVLVQAAAAGTSVVSTSLAGLADEIFENQAVARVVEPGQDDDMAAAIEDVLSIPTMVHDIDYLKVKFSEKRSVERYLSCLYGRTL